MQQWTVKGLSKHRQAKDQTREREKKVREGSGVRAHPEENFKKTINNHIFKSEIETAFKKKKKKKHTHTRAKFSLCVLAWVWA